MTDRDVGRGAMALLDWIRPRRRAPRDLAGLASFVESRAAFLVQKTIYEYSRARASVHSDTLFGEEAFVQAVNRACWTGLPDGLVFEALMVDTRLRKAVAGRPARHDRRPRRGDRRGRRPPADARRARTRLLDRDAPASPSASAAAPPCRRSRSTRSRSPISTASSPACRSTRGCADTTTTPSATACAPIW